MRSASSHAIRNGASRWDSVHARCTNRDSRRRSRWHNGRGFSAMRSVLAAAMIAALVVFFTAPQPKTNPSDEAAFPQIVEAGRDSELPARAGRGHAAQEQATRPDPNRPNAAAPFVRSGLFHWTELS